MCHSPYVSCNLPPSLLLPLFATRVSLHRYEPESPSLLRPLCCDRRLIELQLSRILYIHVSLDLSLSLSHSCLSPQYLPLALYSLCQHIVVIVRIDINVAFLSLVKQVACVCIDEDLGMLSFSGSRTTLDRGMQRSAISWSDARRTDSCVSYCLVPTRCALSMHER